jgi:ribonuclease HII
MPLNRTAALDHELDLWAQGYRFVIGIDEAGRGAWAGPVAAGAVCLDYRAAADLGVRLIGVNDSKQVTPRRRALLVSQIQTHALAHGVGFADASEIDALGIVRATCNAIHRAIAALVDNGAARGVTPDFLLLDSIKCDPAALFPVGQGVPPLPHRPLVHGDQLSLSIAAASILAKVARDTLMVEYDAAHPGYGFASHKGYGARAHQTALAEHGPTPIHRMSFRPMKLLATP